MEEAEKFLKEFHGWKVDKDEKVKLIESTITCRHDNNLKGFDIHYFQYQQENPLGVIFLFHGLTNCADLISPVGNAFKKSNFEVFAFDQLGFYF
jgi:alpha-beta hydrolase superfamily lysophospholipase